MRFFVSHSGKNLAVPCSDSSCSIEKLKQKIVSRFQEDSSSGGKCVSCDGYRLVLAGQEAVLCERDTVEEILKDGDFLILTSKPSFSYVGSINQV